MLVEGVLFEPGRRRRPEFGAARLLPVPHVCRDYVAWHEPADRRHPDEMPWLVTAGPAVVEVGGGTATGAGEVRYTPLPLSREAA